MAIKYKGEVSFKDSEGQTFVLRLGTYQWMEHQDRLQNFINLGKGRDYQCNLFHVALINGSPEQADIKLEDAVEIIDDIGYIKANELIEQTKFGRNLNQASEHDARERKRASASAAASLVPKIEQLKKKHPDPIALMAFEQVVALIEAMQPKAEDSDPLALMASSA